MIAYVEFECFLNDSQSLKDKRAILQKIITRLRQRFNVSVAELDFQDKWQRTKIGIVSIASSKTSAEKVVQQALKMVDSFPEWERAATHYEWL